MDDIKAITVEDMKTRVDNPQPTAMNIVRFLTHSDYSPSEKQDFLDLIDSGYNIDEASDMIIKKRFDDKRLPNDQMNKHRFPMRFNALTGDREKDIEILIERGYSNEQAAYIMELIYAAKLEGLDYSKLQLQDPTITLPEQLLSDRLPKNKQAVPVIKGNVIITQEKGLDRKGMQHAKRMRNMLRGGFQSSISIDHNCALSDAEALKLGLLISQQFCDHGVDMYDALMPSDEDEIERLTDMGYTLDEAILKVFESRFGKTKVDLSNVEVRISSLFL
jgi:hypothetical protein